MKVDMVMGPKGNVIWKGGRHEQLGDAPVVPSGGWRLTGKTLSESKCEKSRECVVTFTQLLSHSPACAMGCGSEDDSQERAEIQPV